MLKPLALSEEFVEVVFPKNYTHNCSKKISKCCHIEQNKLDSYCIGLKQLMEDYHSYRSGELFAEQDYVKRLVSIFESKGSAVEIIKYRCCNKLIIAEGNHRLCISKKLHIPVYAYFEEKKYVCSSCRNTNTLFILFKNLIKFKESKIRPFRDHNHSSPIPKLNHKYIHDLNYIENLLTPIEQIVDNYNFDPLSNYHNLSTEELTKLEILHKKLAGILYLLRRGEHEVKLRNAENSSIENYYDLIEKTPTEKDLYRFE